MLVVWAVTVEAVAAIARTIINCFTDFMGGLVKKFVGLHLEYAGKRRVSHGVIGFGRE
jgi:hypothetical protein